MWVFLGLAGTLACQQRPERSALNLPLDEHAEMPALLSATGAFKDLKTLTPADNLIAYDVNVPFWSDGLGKLRWIVLPAGARIGFSPTGAWSFPPGTVFVKHFDYAPDERQPDQLCRLETRFLVIGAAGKFYGVVYKWRPDGSDADLLPNGQLETLTIQTAAGPKSQTWLFPTATDCRLCHTALSGKVLGVNTRQLNCDVTNPATGAKENQLRAWNRAGRFAPLIAEADFAKFAALAAPSNQTRSLEDRARSWLDANCANCHRPGGVPGFFDARYDTPLAQQNLLHGPVTIDLGNAGMQAILPGDPAHSMILKRIITLKSITMPPVAHHVVDAEAVDLLTAWINSLPAKPTTQPSATPMAAR
jgi:uncharacterized repeat protein (TIGR03806 family)